MAELIFSNDAVDVFYQPGSDPRLLVTFVHMTRVTDQFWGQRPAKNIGISAIGFMTKRHNWYASPETDEAVSAALRIRENFSHVIGYGCSMGAFGAIKYAPVFRFAQTYAFSPQHSIDPKIVGHFDNRYLEHYRDVNRGDYAAAWRRGRTYLIYDPLFRTDERNAAMVDARKCCKHIHVPGSGHMPIEAVASAERFRELMNHGDGEPAELARKLNRWKRNTVPYRLWVAQRLHKFGRTNLALALIAEAQTREPKNRFAKKLLDQINEASPEVRRSLALSR